MCSLHVEYPLSLSMNIQGLPSPSLSNDNPDEGDEGDIQGKKSCIIYVFFGYFLNQSWGAGKFFSSSGSSFFFQAALAPHFFSSGSGSKVQKKCGSGSGSGTGVAYFFRLRLWVLVFSQPAPAPRIKNTRLPSPILNNGMSLFHWFIMWVFFYEI